MFIVNDGRQCGVHGRPGKRKKKRDVSFLLKKKIFFSWRRSRFLEGSRNQHGLVSVWSHRVSRPSDHSLSSGKQQSSVERGTIISKNVAKVYAESLVHARFDLFVSENSRRSTRRVIGDGLNKSPVVRTHRCLSVFRQHDECHSGGGEGQCQRRI